MALGTITRVNQGDLPYTVVGSQRKTIFTVVPGDNSEAVTAAQLGLNRVEAVEVEINDGTASDTGVYATGVISNGGNTVTLAVFDAAGTAATIDSASVLRVIAYGK